MSRIRSQLGELTPLVMPLLFGLMCAALSMGGCSGGLQVASVPPTSPNNTITLNAFSNPVPAGSPPSPRPPMVADSRSVLPYLSTLRRTSPVPDPAAIRSRMVRRGLVLASKRGELCRHTKYW
jgi:hypothetical protein